MRILFLSHYYYPESNAPASRTREHCVRWARAGHDVTVVTCAPNCPDGVVYPGYRNRLRRQVEMVDGVRVVRVWTHLAANAGFAGRIVNYLSYMLSAVLASIRLPRPDVVVATSPQFFCGWAGVLAARLRRAPLVLEIRDIWPDTIEVVGAMRSRLFLRLLQVLERRMYRAARHIVAVGDGYRDNICRKVDVAERISVVTNGVDLGQFTPRGPDAEFLRAHGLTGKFVCSYVGTIGMCHGLEVVLRAAKMLKDKGRRDIAFCFVGDGALRKPLEDEARRAGVDQSVVFLGRVGKETVPVALASSDVCLVHLRKHELFETVIPSKIFEILGMARPIIMGVRGQAREIVHAAGAGLDMEPDSPESLVEAVETLADDRARARRLGASGAAYVRHHFDRDVLAARMLGVLEHAAGRDGEVEKQESLRKAA